LAYWTSSTGIASTKAPANLGFYFDTNTGKNYAINGATAARALLNIYDINPTTVPVTTAPGSPNDIMLWTQQSSGSGTTYQYHISAKGHSIFYGDSTNSEAMTLRADISGYPFGDQFFHFYGPSWQSTVIGSKGLRSGSVIGSLPVYNLHAGEVGYTTGTIAIDAKLASTTLVMTVDAINNTGWTMTLPISGGSSGQVLQTDGSGKTSWVTPSGGGLSGGVSPYFTRWTSATTLSTSSSLFYDANYGGAGPNVVSTDNIYISRGSTTSNIFFGNTTTGTSSLNGFGVGILSTGVAQIRQFENLALETYTNNTKVMSISGSASFGYGQYLDLFRVNETQWSPWQYGKSTTPSGGVSGEYWSGAGAKPMRTGRMIFGTQTNGPSAVTLLEVFSNGGGSGRLQIPNNTAMFYEFKAMCFQGLNVGYQIQNGSWLHRNATLSAPSSTLTTISAFPAGTAWTIALDPTNDCILIQVTTSGSPVPNVRWLFVVDYYEIGI
jgi:hypothetical protein